MHVKKHHVAGRILQKKHGAVFQLNHFDVDLPPVRDRTETRQLLACGRQQTHALVRHDPNDPTTAIGHSNRPCAVNRKWLKEDLVERGTFGREDVETVVLQDNQLSVGEQTERRRGLGSVLVDLESVDADYAYWCNKMIYVCVCTVCSSSFVFPFLHGGDGKQHGCCFDRNRFDQRPSRRLFGRPLVGCGVVVARGAARVVGRRSELRGEGQTGRARPSCWP